jgi:hypothetical protein
MSTYQDLHWDSIRFVKNHLYRRLATPLNNALGRLAIARENPEESREQLRRIEYTMEMGLNVLKAWAALIHVRTGGIIPDAQRRQISPDGLPPWLLDHLHGQTAFRIEQTQPIRVHPESFYESLMLMASASASIGSLKFMVISDAKGSRSGVWVRAVFDPPQAGTYTSLKTLLAVLNLANPVEQDTALQLHLIAEFFRINEGSFVLQNNTQTGEQALAGLVPVAQPNMVEAMAAAESMDQSHRSEAEGEKPILSGPVLAPTPRDVSTDLGPAEDTGEKHTLSASVLAPLPRIEPPVQALRPKLPDGLDRPVKPMTVVPPLDIRRTVVPPAEVPPLDTPIQGSNNGHNGSTKSNN